MKRITLTGKWLMTHPDHVRRQLLRNMFDLADTTGYEIRVAGQHYTT
jgi:hypothetical protein